jgi:hypothetical protein
MLRDIRQNTNEDNQTLRAVALENNWDDINQLRNTTAFQDNERLQSYFSIG